MWTEDFALKMSNGAAEDNTNLIRGLLDPDVFISMS